MNEVNVLLADNEDFKFVEVVFAPYTGNSTYTYKTVLDVQEDDFAVVDTPSKGFQVVQIRKLLSPFEVDFDVKFSYKWLVQKVDTSGYEQAVAKEKEILQLVNKSKNKRAITAAKEAILESTDAEAVAKLVRL